jgi:AraC-like DNA-binding protein
MMRFTMSREAVRVSAETRVAADVDAIAAAMSDGLRGEYVQLESRPFRGRWTIVRTASAVAQFASEEVAVARRLRVPTSRWAFVVPLDVPAAARWNGRPVHDTDVLVCPPGTECLAFDPPATRYAIVTAKWGAKITGSVRSLLGSVAADPITVACGTDLQDLRHRLARLRDRIERGRPVTSISQDDAIFDAPLCACLARAIGARADVPVPGSKSGIVRTAEEFFRRHASEGVSVAQLSTIAGVSERSLRNAFYDVYTTSPKRYMKLWQLHQVRRALRSADVRGATVTDVATCHGFYELGRFAGAYKSLFGEAPSETLSKARTQHTMQGGAC